VIALATDIVSFFSEQRGFGLISRGVGDDVSVHFFTVNATTFTALPDGEGLEFAFLGRTGDEASSG
jgi:cold shock CspA family protein